MSVYELEHVTIEAIGDPAKMYRITAEPGWYIHLPEHEELVYKTVVALLATYDFSAVQIVAAADLPPDAEIYGDNIAGETI